jgi:hypothetical protein
MNNKLVSTVAEGLEPPDGINKTNTKSTKYGLWTTRILWFMNSALSR